MPENLNELVDKLSSFVGQKQVSVPEVIESGVQNPRIDPSVMNFLLQASIASQAIKIRKYFDDRTSRGYIETWGSRTPLTITDMVRELEFTSPAQSASLINDGAQAVYVEVNTIGRPEHEVRPGETFNLDFETHKLERLYLRCDPGLSTTVRIVANN